MIVQEFNLLTVPWNVLVFYHPDREDMPLIYSSLVEIHCASANIDDVMDFISLGIFNTGCTLSCDKDRKSVIIISKTTDAAQFNDTYDHEKGHLAMHICMADGMNPFSEEYQYLTGEIGRKMFVGARRFLCDNCRH